MTTGAVMLLLGLSGLMLGVLILAVRDGAKRNEQVDAYKREKAMMQKQVEVANEQTEIANDAPVTRGDALKRLRQRSKSNR